MLAEEIKANIHRILDEAWNKGNLGVLDELYAADFVHHRPPFPDIEGLEGYKEFVADVCSAYPDLHLTIDEIILEGDTGATRITFWGTHTGQGSSFPFRPPASR